jgi:hypothetical protein
VPSWTEVVAHRAERLQESLRLIRRLEPLHRSLAFAHRPMRVLGPVIQPLVAAVLSVRQSALDSRYITGKLVSDDHSRLNFALGVQYAAEKPLGRVLVSSTLDKDIQHQSILVNSAPQPVATLVHGQRHLVQEPLVAASRMAPMEVTSQQRAELAAPQADGLVTDLDAALSERA